jgi:hypothetical protein
MPDDAIDRLVALEAIKQVKYAYCRCLDQKLWDEMVTLLHPDAIASYSGGKYHFEGRDAVVDFMQRNMSREAFLSSHRVHHPEIEFESPTRARAVWALDDVNVDTEFGIYLTGAAFYNDIYVVEDDRWVILDTRYKRTFETIRPLSGPDLSVTASWWATDGRSDLDVQ